MALVYDGRLGSCSRSGTGARVESFYNMLSNSTEQILSASCLKDNLIYSRIGKPNLLREWSGYDESLSQIKTTSPWKS